MKPEVIDRLKSQLLTSGISQQNQALYQIINTLIDAAKANAFGVKDINTMIESGEIGTGGSGTPGPQGAAGNPGMPGLDGYDGIDGEPGLIGPIGPQGIQGPAGAGASGHMFNDNNDTLIAIAAAHTVTEVDAGFSAGQLDGFTFNGTHRLVCQVPGKYLMVYSISLLLESVANRTFEAMFLIDGVVQSGSTNHTEVSIGGSGRPSVISGNMTADLVQGNEISLAVENHDDGTDVLVVHANVSIFAAAGPDGPAGPTGPIGQPGLFGIDGIDGIDGEMGFPGPAGINGINGTIGRDGMPGPPGLDADEPLEPLFFPGPKGDKGDTGVGGGGDILLSYKKFTPAEIYSLNTVPVEVIATPGSNKFLFPIYGFWVYIRATPYSTTATLTIRWTGVTTPTIFTGINLGLAAAGGAATLYRNVTPSVISAAIGTFDPTNKGIEVIASASNTVGTGPVFLWLVYYVMDIS